MGVDIQHFRMVTTNIVAHVWHVSPSGDHDRAGGYTHPFASSFPLVYSVADPQFGTWLVS